MEIIRIESDRGASVLMMLDFTLELHRHDGVIIEYSRDKEGLTRALMEVSSVLFYIGDNLDVELPNYIGLFNI